jgi:hypothetical protein
MGSRGKYLKTFKKAGAGITAGNANIYGTCALQKGG